MTRVRPDDVTAAHAVAGPVRIWPFPAVRLSPARVGDPASARLLARPYRSVPERIQRWRRLGNLVQDDEPALYVHEYTSQGLTVRAVVGLLSISPYAAEPHEAALLPHEDVAPRRADDLAARLRTMRVNPAPLQLLHTGTPTTRDLVAGVVKRPTEADYVDRAGQRHRLWRVDEQREADDLAGALATSRLVLADGHHRLAAYQRLHEQSPGEPWDRALAMVVDHADTPLFLGAIHRVVHGVPLDTVVEAARRQADVREVDVADRLNALGPDTLVLTDRTSAYAVDLTAHPEALAVEFLHEHLIPTDDVTRIEYHHSTEAALQRLQVAADQDLSRFAVLLPALRYDALTRVLSAGRRLPEKATSFQPKPSIGAVMRVF